MSKVITRRFGASDKAHDHLTQNGFARVGDANKFETAYIKFEKEPNERGGITTRVFTGLVRYSAPAYQVTITEAAQ
ncbi:hypothetical protein [Ensifer aridi]|uniref:hypothetical protein n=1 Tax=Ensifer aridi TaxID=1708715 RepID=UPI000A0F6B32|nr:hypothetical protein [Ensifer aridi]